MKNEKIIKWFTWLIVPPMTVLPTVLGTGAAFQTTTKNNHNIKNESNQYYH